MAHSLSSVKDRVAGMYSLSHILSKLSSTSYQALNVCVLVEAG